MLSYYVFKTGPKGQLWMSCGDYSEWTPDYHDAAEFTSEQRAKDAGEAHTDDTETVWVFGLCPS